MHPVTVDIVAISFFFKPFPWPGSLMLSVHVSGKQNVPKEKM